MKHCKNILSAAMLFVLCVAQAQNPWAKYGYIPPKALTLSNGQYEEFFTNDTVVQIGSVMFNTVTNKVVAFLQTDTVYSEATLKPEIISRFLSPDPLEKEYPYYTPYQFAGNEPIKFVDLDGKEPGYLDPKSGNIIPASSSILHTPPSNAQYFNQTIDPVVVQNYTQLAAVLTSTFMSPVLSQTVKTVIGLIKIASKEETPTPAPKLNNGNAQTTETAATNTSKSINKLKPSEEATGAHTSFK